MGWMLYDHMARWKIGDTKDPYANTEEECERLLAAMISDMKVEVAAEKERLTAENRAS